MKFKQIFLAGIIGGAGTGMALGAEESLAEVIKKANAADDIG